ncbi:MAG TPA: UDP-N-acetylglucosamine 2-epimerase [Candidatus Omnitrophota bacterium]|nr:UDP-N-acetylglucosamine 2-epimerase [Candidatus Omnitrophota bacterium]HRZ15291.1 UDP-N-acetylglucosamine 2-epimerase [Candidatus Omnitrophota bacterium]
MKRKVCVVVASRANYGRIKSVLQAVKRHPGLELQLVVAASALLYRFGNVVELIEQDGFKIDSRVYIIIEGENPTTMAKSTGLAIMELATIFENLRPDIVLTVADRFETMATAVAASYMNIPLAHTQGGEVTGSIDESVRHAITKLAHLHFPATALSRDRLVRMGEDPASIYLTGCPSIDIVCQADVKRIDVLKKYGGVGSTIDPRKPFLMVLQHPVTTEYADTLNQIGETIKAVATLKMPTIWLWPNVDAGSDDISKALRVFRETDKPEYVHFYRNFEIADYACLMNNCACFIGNSSSALREGAFLGVPAVNIGTRQNRRERGKNVIDAGYDADSIVAAVRKQIRHGKYERDLLFGDGNAGSKIADVLAAHAFTIQKQITF